MLGERARPKSFPPNAAGAFIPRARFPGRIRRASLASLTFAVIVIVPTLVVAVYFALIASDQYVAQTKLAVRERASPGAGALAKVAIFATLSHSGRDAYFVASYLRSRNVVERLDRDRRLRAIFSRPEADFYARFDPSLPDEELWLYWRKMVDVNVDSLSGIITIRARAFRPADAVWLCEQLAQLADEVVSEIGARSRKNTLLAAETEKQRAAERFVKATVELQGFRDSRGTIDPIEAAIQRLKSIFSATLERSSAAAVKSMANTEAVEGAPALATLDAKIQALDQQIAELNRLLTAPEANARVASAAIADYSRLELEKTLAEKQYALASEILEASRESVESKTSFVATFIPPILPHAATMPRRSLNTMAIFVSALIVWGMIRVVIAAIRSEIE